jgi:uncharacterized protein YggU (UPF0235/DUF167 family)
MSIEAVDPAPWRLRTDGLAVRVPVTPRGGRDAIEGITTLADGCRALEVRVRAVPEDGAANATVQRLLARKLGLPVSTMGLAAGTPARLKTFVITGEAGPLVLAIAGLKGRYA